MAWVVMPDHMHWVFQLLEVKALSVMMRLFKGRSAHRLNQYLNRQGAVWQKAYYDHVLREEEDVRGCGTVYCG